uniref:Uncharacterized protein n=1 Tax=Arundo donax TaxID=35708 RepID=A0A0A9GNK5_ARUDO
MFSCSAPGNSGVLPFKCSNTGEIFSFVNRALRLDKKEMCASLYNFEFEFPYTYDMRTALPKKN